MDSSGVWWCYTNSNDEIIMMMCLCDGGNRSFFSNITEVKRLLIYRPARRLAITNLNSGIISYWLESTSRYSDVIQVFLVFALSSYIIQL
jgi:hypothetical protein